MELWVVWKGAWSQADVQGSLKKAVEEQRKWRASGGGVLSLPPSSVHDLSLGEFSKWPGLQSVEVFTLSVPGLGFTSLS